MFKFALMTLAMFLVSCGPVTRASTVLTKTGVAADGEKVFLSNSCGGCHGANGKGITGSGPNLLTASSKGEKFVDVIIAGDGSMPSYPKLTDQQLADLLAWAKAIK